MRFAVPLAAALVCTVSLASGQAYRNLHSFGGSIKDAAGQTAVDGTNSNAGVVLDKAGDMFGTASSGGVNGAGLVWEITAAGVYKDLHDFGGTTTNAGGSSGPDGANPIAGVTLDVSGNLYGTASEGGPNNSANGGYGMLWEITSTGTYKDLHDFGGTVTNANGKSGPDGVLPYAGVTFDGKGNMYGTTSGGGPNDTDSGGDGMVWELSSADDYADLHDFGGSIKNAGGATGPDGLYPAAGVALDSKGNVYGVAPWGGANDQASGGDGMLFEITSGGYLDLHDFGGSITNANGTTGPDGVNPWANVVFDTAGNLYGTTLYGGPNTSDVDSGGVLWTLTASAAYKDLHDFGGTVTIASGSSGPDGNRIVAGVTFDASGNLYGTALYGGPNDEIDGGDGMVWKFLVSTSKYQDLHDFGATITNPSGTTSPDGINPEAGVTIDAGGNLYGTTYFGGTYDAGIGGDGLTWLLVAGGIKTVTLSPTTVIGGASTTGTITLTAAAPTGGLSVALKSSSTVATVPASVTIPAGASSATCAVKTIPVAANTSVTLTITLNGVSKTVGLTVDAPTMTSLTLNPTTLVGAASSTGTIVLSGPAPTGGTVVTLASNSSAAKPPATVTLAAGKTSTTFTVTTVAVAAKTSATIKATLGSASLTQALTIYPPQVSSLSVSPNSVIGGVSSTGTVKLGAVAPTGGVVVTLSSSSTAGSVPASVTVAAGASSATFTVKTVAVAASTAAKITATDGPTPLTTTLTVTPPTLSSITLASSSIIGGTQAGGVVAITGIAPTGGIVVSLSSSSSAATVPASVTVPAGKDFVVFTLSSTPVTANVTVTITGKSGSASTTAKITIDAPALTSLTLSPTSLVGGASSNGTVTISGQAPTGGFTVTLSSNSTSATVPASVVIPAGKVNVAFTIKTTSVKSQVTATITAKNGSVSETASLTIKT